MDKKRVKQKLDEELRTLQFTKQADVLEKLIQPTQKDKLHAWWNKEIAIPILPVSSAVFLLLFGYGFFTLYDSYEENEEKTVIEINGNTYWKDELERRISIEE